MSHGVLYVAYGEKAQQEQRMAAETVRQHHPTWPILLVGEHNDHRIGTEGGLAGRWAKVNLDQLTPFDHTLFLDADTRVRSSMQLGFDLLAQGWDFVAVPSWSDWLNHINDAERQVTQWETPAGMVEVNSGVMWFRKSDRVMAFFEEWRRQWQRYRGPDQGAFLRALARCPMRLFLLAKPWNSAGGAIVEHRFGMCR